MLECEHVECQNKFLETWTSISSDMIPMEAVKPHHVSLYTCTCHIHVNKQFA